MGSLTSPRLFSIFSSKHWKKKKTYSRIYKISKTSSHHTTSCLQEKSPGKPFNKYNLTTSAGVTLTATVQWWGHNDISSNLTSVHLGSWAFDLSSETFLVTSVGSSSVPVWQQQCASVTPEVCRPRQVCRHWYNGAATLPPCRFYSKKNFSFTQLFPLLPPNNVSGICFVAFLAATLEPSWTSDQAIKLLLPFPMTYSVDMELLLKTNVSQNLKSRWSFLALIVTSSQKSFSTDFVETWRMFEATLGRITKLKKLKVLKLSQSE